MKHQGLDLAGIIITYVFSVSIVAAMILSLVSWGWLEGYEIVLLLLGLITLVLVSLYHANIVKNRIIVGIFATLISVLGGVFILVDTKQQSRSDDRSVDSNSPEKIKVSESNPIEKLRIIHKLFKSELVPVEIYETKKKEILDNFLMITPQPNNKTLKVSNLILGILWLFTLFMTLFGGYIYSFIDIILLLYAILISIFMFISPKNLRLTNIILQFIILLVFVLFFTVIAPSYSFSGLIPLISIFGAIQLFVTILNILNLTKKEKTIKNVTNYMLIEKFKLLFDEQIINEFEMKSLIEKHL
jgi:MFS family permease